jgi:alpha/beta superfamily hydrolase
VLIEPVALASADGLDLEGELALPAGDALWAGAVLAHPHPQFGGNMRSIVPGTLFAGLPPEGVAALRFNFRGVGRSAGTYGGGVDEALDVVAALDRLVDAVGPSVPVILAGWSFGADVSLSVGDQRLAGWFAAAPPLRTVEPSAMAAATDPRPKLLAVPERDQYRRPESARQVVATWPNCRVEVVPGADHYFVGRTQTLTPLCLDLLRSL